MDGMMPKCIACLPKVRIGGGGHDLWELAGTW
jgi:hypothetical protein